MLNLGAGVRDVSRIDFDKPTNNVKAPAMTCNGRKQVPTLTGAHTDDTDRASGE